MSDLKTKATNKSVTDFLDSVKHPQRRKEGLELLKLMQDSMGEKPVMWGESIVARAREIMATNQLYGNFNPQKSSKVPER
jgi:hypothetical protein